MEILVLRQYIVDIQHLVGGMNRDVDNYRSLHCSLIGGFINLPYRLRNQPGAMISFGSMDVTGPFASESVDISVVAVFDVSSDAKNAGFNRSIETMIGR